MSFIICWRASIVLVFLLRVFSWSYCYGYVYSDSTNYPKRNTVFSFLANHQASPSSTINYSSRLSRMDSGERSLSPTELPSHHHKGREVAPSAEPPSIAPSRHHHHKKPKNPVAASPSVRQVPPEGCSTTNCTEPLTYSPPDSPCACVLPMQVVIEFAVAPYAIFPMITELADEVASGTYLKPSQVRIIGANPANQDQDMTTVKIDLVPLEDRFDSTTAFLTFQRLWEKKFVINRTLFGDYQVVYVVYPGLPPSPPSPFENLTSGANGNPIPGYGEDPLGVDIKKRNEKMDHGTIAVVAFSSAVAVVICCGVVWLIILKFINQQPEKAQKPVIPTCTSSVTKKSGGGSIRSSSMTSSISLSFFSSVLASTGAAKVFTLAELEKATSRFSSKNIVGEGGFGRVYRGGLEDGTTVAVKVLTRDDHQGGREFIAEVEMLSRLHHRNLVKLIGICTEGHHRCLVYELIPNGSVESHLHGQEKECAPLDWDARMKIALGAARGLAYLHEDSNPRVIHRDFKASNILLEDDFTPKVSDFGLAKVATDEGKGHISTRVMGTFGYVAPEYAMTGHLLVKSDVYSYGVVLLELLTGRKPVDMSQPPGQENLVTWARPLLSSRDGLETLIDSNLKGSLSFDSVSKVAAIASMCVQPEVSNRPFMGEVVQALKLVYNDADGSNGEGSQNQSEGEDVSRSEDSRDNAGLRRYMRSNQYGTDDTSFVTIDYDSGPLRAQDIEAERPLSASALLLSSSGRFDSDGSESFRRHSSSGPLSVFRSKRYGYRITGLVGGSMSEHSITRHSSPAFKLHRDDLFL